MLLKRLTVMALHCYFKPKDGLPDPRGTLSASTQQGLSSSMARANVSEMYDKKFHGYETFLHKIFAQKFDIMKISRFTVCQ